jgi:hypothetical protein
MAVRDGYGIDRSVIDRFTRATAAAGHDAGIIVAPALRLVFPRKIN